MSAFKLALDAGHGYNTAGRRCLAKYDPEQHREWWLNNRICNYIAERASAYDGFETYRVDDTTGKTDVALKTRCALANEKGADLYYSAHHNADINGGKGGGVTAYSCPNSSNGRKWRDLLYAAIVEAGDLKGNRSTPKSEVSYYVLKHTTMPAVLIEHGFMDSSTDIPVIISEDYAKKVGYAVADAIAKEAGLKLKKASTTPTAKSYKVTIDTDELNVRKDASASSEVVTVVKRGEVFTIVAEKMNGSTKWGKLKSGAGWISLRYTKKI